MFLFFHFSRTLLTRIKGGIGFVIKVSAVLLFGAWQYAMAQELLNLGNSLAAAGQLEQAEEVYLQAIEAGENEAIVRYNLANLQYRNKKVGEAVLNYRRVIAIAPQFKNAYFNLGKLYFKAKDYSEAFIIFNAYRKQLKNALNYSPENSYDVTMLIADTAFELQNYAKAVFEYRNAISIISSYPEPYLMLVEVYLKLGDIDTALETLHQGENAVLDAVPLANMRAQLQYDAKNYKAAVESYSMLLSLLSSRTKELKDLLKKDDKAREAASEQKKEKQEAKKNSEKLEENTEKLLTQKSNYTNNTNSVETNIEVLSQSERLRTQALLEENTRQLFRMQLFQADAFYKAGYTNLSIYALQKILLSINNLAAKGKSAGGIPIHQKQALQLLESLYQENDRLPEAFDYFKNIFPAVPTLAYGAIRNLLVRSYNDNKKELQEVILQFYDEKGIEDEVYNLLKNTEG